MKYIGKPLSHKFRWLMFEYESSKTYILGLFEEGRNVDMPQYNLRCPGSPVGNFLLKTILFCIEPFDHIDFIKERKGKMR
jgi:hypothetical protein